MGLDGAVAGRMLERCGSNSIVFAGIFSCIFTNGFFGLQLKRLYSGEPLWAYGHATAMSQKTVDEIMDKLSALAVSYERNLFIDAEIYI